tara:strand:- start:5429 stop:7672 length:2244 start_codon:yes stop_codon:yes gene_type:complete
MSINKVLNRPMFRNVALKKGHVKPIHAEIGVMVGGPRSVPQVPAVVPGQGVFSPVNLQKFGPPKPTFMQNVMRSRPVRFGAGIANIPAYLGFEGTGILADAFGMKDSPYKSPLQIAGAIGATRLPGAAALGSIGFLPSAVGIGTLALIADRTKAGIELRKKINAMSPEEREDFIRQNRLKSTDYFSEGVSDQDLFGKFVPKPPEPKQVKAPQKTEGPQPGAGRVNKRVLKAEGDELLNDKFESADGTASLTKIQDNSIGPVPPPDTPDVDSGRGGDSVSALERAEVVKETNAQKNPEANGDNIILKGGASGDAEFNNTIKLARKYYDEVYQNKGSQANLVFLANLASGLLTGTTARSGISGALEVLGQALGPAVNNYATIKLKEGELRQNAREASLNAAMDHMKFLNDAANIENPEQDPGVIQIRLPNGDLSNIAGFQRKDGTVTIPAGVLGNRETFVPVPQGGVIKDSEGRVIGKFENFFAQKQINDRLFDIQDILGNRYDALSTTNKVLSILDQEDKGEKVKAGAGLVIDQFTRRLSGVGKELLGGSTIKNFDQELAELQSLQKDEIKALDRALAAGEIEQNEYDRDKKAIEIGNFKDDGLLKEAKERLLAASGTKGFFSGLSREDQEALAVYETKLVYALANTFKDQDRLTQRDINAAREIVNIFSLTRAGADVKASIRAIARGLRADIRRQEKLFKASGGLDTTLKDLRALKDFVEFEGQEGLEQQLGKALGIDEINKIIGTI